LQEDLRYDFFSQPKAVLIDLIYKMEKTCINITRSMIEVINDADMILGQEDRGMLLPHLRHEEDNWVDILLTERNFFQPKS